MYKRKVVSAERPHDKHTKVEPLPSCITGKHPWGTAADREATTPLDHPNNAARGIQPRLSQFPSRVMSAVQTTKHLCVLWKCPRWSVWLMHSKSVSSRFWCWEYFGCWELVGVWWNPSESVVQIRRPTLIVAWISHASQTLCGSFVKPFVYQCWLMAVVAVVPWQRETIPGQQFLSPACHASVWTSGSQSQNSFPPLATYWPGLFQSQAFFFGYALAPLVVAYAPQWSPRGLSMALRRATSGSEVALLCSRTFWAAVRASVSPKERILSPNRTYKTS